MWPSWYVIPQQLAGTGISARLIFFTVLVINYREILPPAHRWATVTGRENVQGKATLAQRFGEKQIAESSPDLN